VKKDRYTALPKLDPGLYREVAEEEMRKELKTNPQEKNGKCS
jgi:hypothetical protein